MKAGQALLGRASRGERLDVLPPPKHGDSVGDLEDLVQLVADEDDREALPGERAQDLEELSGLLWREHRGRLVEDEDVGLGDRAPS